MTEVLKQSDVKKTTTEFLAFPFKTPSTVYVLHFGFLNNGEFFRKFYSANLIKAILKLATGTWSCQVLFLIQFHLKWKFCLLIPSVQKFLGRLYAFVFSEAN